MTPKQVTIRGIRVNVVPDGGTEIPCDSCTFHNSPRCPTVRELAEAELSACHRGNHYYTEVTDDQPLQNVGH